MPPPLHHTRKTVALPDALWRAVSEYRHRERIASEVEALRRLVDAGVKAWVKAEMKRAERRTAWKGSPDDAAE